MFDPTDPNHIEIVSAPLSAKLITTVTFYDGLGRVIQTQNTLDNIGSDHIVTSKTYNAIGKVEKEFVPDILGSSGEYIQVESDLEENPVLNSSNMEENTVYIGSGTMTVENATVCYGFTKLQADEIFLKAGFNICSGVTADIIATEVPGNCELYIYEDNPLARLKVQIHRDGELIAYDYGAEEFDLFDDNNSRAYRFVQATDEKDKISKEYYDIFGNAIGGTDTGEDESQVIKSITYGQVYNILGQLTQVLPPNYYNPPGSSSHPPDGTTKEDWNNGYNTYNTLGQMTEKKTLEDDANSSTKYICDKNGNLRFSQNGHQAANGGTFTVYCYDAHNRVTIIGEEVNLENAWTSPSTRPNIDGNYGTDSYEWKIKHTYDENQVSGSENYCIGRLTMTIINATHFYGEDLPHEISYIYDKFGNISEKQIYIFDGEDISKKIIKYQYDLLNRVTEIEYPSGKVVTKSYDNIGRLDKVYCIE